MEVGDGKMGAMPGCCRLSYSVSRGIFDASSDSSTLQMEEL